MVVGKGGKSRGAGRSVGGVARVPCLRRTSSRQQKHPAVCDTSTAGSRGRNFLGGGMVNGARREVTRLRQPGRDTGAISVSTSISRILAGPNFLNNVSPARVPSAAPRSRCASSMLEYDTNFIKVDYWSYTRRRWRRWWSGAPRRSVSSPRAPPSRTQSRSASRAARWFSGSAPPCPRTAPARRSSPRASRT